MDTEMTRYESFAEVTEDFYCSAVDVLKILVLRLHDYHIRAANSLMQSIRSAIRGLQRWIADLNEKKQLLLDALEKAKEPTLSDLLVDYFNLRNEQRSDWSGKAKLKCTVRDFEEVKRAVDYLKAHSLNTIEDLDTAISNLNQTTAPLRRQLKQNEDRMRAIAQIKDAAAVH